MPLRKPPSSKGTSPSASVCLAFGIQRDNPDAAYHGLTVGPKDADKVLLRWKLEDGRYQVIYGDLRSEVVSKDELDKLEAR